MVRSAGSPPRVGQARRALLAAVLALAGATSSLGGARSVARILEQDPSLNNLVDPPGYRTAPPGTLGAVAKAGTGSEAMILIPGLGFGGGIFEPLAQRFEADFTTHAVTLAGFGGSAAAPAPPETTSFGEQTWTNGALAALERLLAEERIERAVVVGHWLTGTQLALRLALARPETIRAVVLLAGSARMTTDDPARAARIATPQMRVAVTDQFLAPRWFKTVTRETWDDNNFLPADYAVHPLVGLRLWREAARPPLHVWVRFLNEFNAQDVCAELPRLTVPTLLLEPGREGHEHDPANDYLKLYLHDSWAGCVEHHPKVAVRTIPRARVALWYDQPQAVEAAMREFLGTARAGAGPPPSP
jgi:pimeloyl-ACP methyl ester carboxylesterase